jgi:hypothetical protein
LEGKVMTVLDKDTPVKPFETCSFLWGDRNYLLRRPVRCLSARQEGLWVFECPEYGLSAFSADRAAAFQQFNENFAFLYEGLIHEANHALTPDAKKLRDRLQADVQEAQSLA